MARIHNDNPFSTLLFGGFHGISEEGIPRAIQDKYDQTVNKLMWTTYDGLWSAAASGIAKGIMVTSALVLGASGLMFGLAGSTAEGLVVSAGTASLAEGVAAGLSTALGALMTPAFGIPILAAGAAVGALYDVTKRHHAVHKELAETRTMIRGHMQMIEESLSKQQEIKPDAPAASADVGEQSQYWQNKVAGQAAQAQYQQQGV